MEEKLVQVQNVYSRLIQAWNDRHAEGMAELFSEDGEMIGFDGSQEFGTAAILKHLTPIFDTHPTPPFVTKIKEVKFLSADVALVRAIAGMIPPGEKGLNPDFHTHHTLVAVYEEGRFQIELFQNTPAQFHGRPELVNQMTEELNKED
ncbi:SgcJ/EcaC family oxidoreductase [Halobacillus salinarum]|uniref:SgcJ/EcaC family oxidoreductase n=1 Tax=Halobacillus salinarum TaxID=2932257 RepID=A0ABY4EH34_9BACI|nr:SgcJ/EcaC family oxidoreductase [Halobacillus salinarum]UOQ43779.1 SgcJ/EcaC family oxidoreductase [Halobacillus salinarum]